MQKNSKLENLIQEERNKHATLIHTVNKNKDFSRKIENKIS